MRATSRLRWRRALRSRRGTWRWATVMPVIRQPFQKRTASGRVVPCLTSSPVWRFERSGPDRIRTLFIVCLSSAALEMADLEDVTRAPDASEKPTIGPYRFLERIGEGGMGEVWLANQTQPIHRQVAIKIIKAGMDTAQVVARFEVRRQPLALMSHPGTAQVFDAGVTPQGRPFFAMEYVRGESITTYCNKHRLTIRQRLDLFLEVCDGVQHAHQKGIIHRDLKP